MRKDRMYELARALADAKSKQDVPAAMELFHPDMVLEAPAFGTRARGLPENEKALKGFFHSFPDYDVTLDGHAADGEVLVCWGTVRMTMSGDRFGVVPNGHRATLPVFIQFTFADDRIASERFFFDLSALCVQSGVSTDAVRARLFADSRSRAEMATRAETVDEIATTHLFDIVVDLKPPLNLGAGPYGRRVLYGAAGGTFEGTRLRGEVLAGGGDWALFRPDGSMMLDVRLTLRTHDGALVLMTYGGRWIIPPDLQADMADPVRKYEIDPSRYYFRTAPLFETGAKEYAWLNNIVCVGSGHLVEGAVAYKVSQVL
jgi:predicted ester cyclase